MVSHWLDDVENVFLKRTQKVDGSQENVATWFDDTKALIGKASEERMRIQAVIEKVSSRLPAPAHSLQDRV
jgi:hypothetical protein